MLAPAGHERGCLFLGFLDYRRNVFGSVQQSELTLALRTHTHTQSHTAVLRARTNAGTNKMHIKPVWVWQRVLISVLRTICQGICSFKQPCVNRDEALFRGAAVAVFTHPRVSIRIMRASFYLFKHTDQSLM